MRGHPGLGGVEVIAAMLILAVCLLPLMDMARTLQRQTLQLEDRQKRAEHIQSALAYFRTVNVGETPQSSQTFGDWSLSWQAELGGPDTAFEARRQNRPPTSIGLYNVELVLTYRLDGRLREAAYTTRAVGWREETGS